MPALSEYTNVYNTAVLILERKGYRVWLDSESDLYFCERDGWDFASESPCGLLGLVAIYEMKAPDTYREYWWREEGPERYLGLSKQAPSYESVVSAKRGSP